MKVSVLGFPVSTKPKDACISEMTDWTRACGSPKYFVCANPYSLEMARKDPCFAEAIIKADLVIPDGIGVVIASRILGGKIPERIAGPDIFFSFSREMDKRGDCSYFFLGSTKEALGKIGERMKTDFPNIDVRGLYSPPFKEEFGEAENRKIIRLINDAKPDVLWVGMTAPKQEKWIYRNIDRLEVKCIGPIGAAFDFYAGTVKRAHPWFQRHGLEWLGRFLKEPGRMWKRYLVYGPIFMMRAILFRLKLDKLN